MIDVNSLAGTNWNYDFLEIGTLEKNTNLGRPGLAGYAAKTKPLFDAIADRWSPELHAEWLQRQYVSLKLIMGATLQFGSADHAYEENLQMAVPYLSYYGMFNAIRANILTSPRSGWGKKSLTIGHDKAMQRYVEEIGLLLSPDEITHNVTLFVNAKRGRELFSYRFPSDGAPGKGGFFVHRDKAERFARVAAELALFNSFCLGAAVETKFGTYTEWSGFQIDDNLLSTLWGHVLQGSLGEDDYVYIDQEDKRRVKRMARTVCRPLPFIWLIGEGGIEDFFGSFSSIIDNGAAFDPDEHWNRLLELP